MLLSSKFTGFPYHFLFIYHCLCCSDKVPKPEVLEEECLFELMFLSEEALITAGKACQAGSWSHASNSHKKQRGTGRGAWLQTLKAHSAFYISFSKAPCHFVPHQLGVKGPNPWAHRSFSSKSFSSKSIQMLFIQSTTVFCFGNP